MGDKRKGEVIHIDIEQGIGIIIDENGQDIHFLLNEISDQINVYTKVYFEIELGKHGLAAVKIELEVNEIKI